MAYRYLINGKWILCNQEDNELLVDLRDFFIPYHGARYPDGKILSMQDSLTVRDIAVQRWCERGHIKLEWTARPNELAPPNDYKGGYLGAQYLLVFETADDAMLFKLHFNNDSRVDN